MSGSVYGLHRYLDQYAQLVTGPPLVANLVPEILPWQTPLSYMRPTAWAVASPNSSWTTRRRHLGAFWPKTRKPQTAPKRCLTWGFWEYAPRDLNPEPAD